MAHPSADPVKFAYWVPNVSGGLVVSKIEQRTDWGYDYNRQLAVLAENNGFEYALSQVRYIASYGAAYQHESTGFSLALLLATERLKVIAAIHPGLWHPGVLAKFIATADQISGGRAAVNVVSGWFKDEFTKLGEPWLEHDERYRRSEEFIRVLREIWTSEHAEFNGDFYRLHDFDLKPKPIDAPARHPEIFQGGNSTSAQLMAGRVSDWYFSNGKDFDGVSEQIANVTWRGGQARAHGAVRPERLHDRPRHREGSPRDLREIVAKADREAVEGFGSAVKQAGQSTGNKTGMWQDSNVRRSRPVQRRLPHPAHRHARADRRADRRVQEARREPHAARLPALPRRGRVLRQERPADRPRSRSRRHSAWRTRRHGFLIRLDPAAAGVAGSSRDPVHTGRGMGH